MLAGCYFAASFVFGCLWTRALYSTGSLRDREMSFPKSLFCSTISLSLVFIQLVLCEIADWADSSTRHSVWILTTSLLVVILTFVSPYAIIRALAMGLFPHSSRTLHRILSLSAFLVWLLLFYLLGTHLPESANYSFISQCISRISLLGISALASLSGFGSITATYKTFIEKEKPVTDSDILRLQTSIRNIQTLRDLKIKSIQELDHFQKYSNISSPSPQSKSIKRSTSSLYSSLKDVISSPLTGSDNADERHFLETELSSLSKMLSVLQQDLQTMSQKRKQQNAKKTTFGKIWALCFFVFSCYCIYKILNIGYKLLVMLWYFKHHPNHDSYRVIKTNDAISVTISHIIIFIIRKISGYELDVDSVARQVGFCLSGGIFIGSLGPINSTLRSISRATSHSYTLSSLNSDSYPSSLEPKRENNVGSYFSIAHNLFISQITGIYLISQSLLLRGNLPLDFVANSMINKLLVDASLDIGFIDGIFNRFYGIGVVLSIVVLGVTKLYMEDDIDNEMIGLQGGLEEEMLEGNKLL